MYASPRPFYHCQGNVRDSQEAALDGMAYKLFVNLFYVPGNTKESFDPAYRSRGFKQECFFVCLFLLLFLFLFCVDLARFRYTMHIYNTCPLHVCTAL